MTILATLSLYKSQVTGMAEQPVAMMCTMAANEPDLGPDHFLSPPPPVGLALISPQYDDQEQGSE